MSKKISSNGFTLIELSVGLAVLGLMIYTTLAVFTERSAIDKVAVTQRKLDVIEDALRQFYLTNLDLPCPADGMLPLNDAAFGMEDCLEDTDGMNLLDGGDGLIGIVPTRGLNLPDDYMFDAWGHRISYSVNTGHTGYSSVNWPSTPVIEINDHYGNPITGQAVYVLVSHGKNGVGAWRRVGGNSKVPDNGVTANEAANACVDSSGAISNMDMVFVDAFFNDTTIAGANYFDDIIRWKTKEMVDYDADRLP